MSGTLTCDTISKSYGAKTVLDGVTLTIAPGDRVGLVGPNGVGKSTLLRICARLEAPDDGRVVWSPPDLRVGYLPQEAGSDDAETVRERLARRSGVAAAEAEVDRLAAGLEREAALAQRYVDAVERFVALGGDDFEARAATICDEVGVDQELLDRPVRYLSGGQAAKASLASILLARFDVFLLDEPTNDLDFDGLDRLERFVHDLEGGAVIVSHDRAFLERTVTEVLEIDEGTRRGRLYGGGFDAYVRGRELAREHAYEAFERSTAERRTLEERTRQVRSWAEKGAARAKRKPRDNDKAQRDFFLNRTEKQASKVRALERRLDRLEAVPKPYEPWELRLSLRPQSRSGDVVVRLREAVVERGDFRLGPLSLEVRWPERVAVVGPNGSGKTTLLRAVLGELPLAAGRRYLGPSVVVGSMDQRRDAFAGSQPLLEAFVAQTRLPEADARTLLAKFRLGATEVLRSCASLSPGERSRAILAALQAEGVNCLILDEPTNHLDLPAIEQLEEALDAFEGSLVLVTHDRRLLEHVRIDRTVQVEAGRIVATRPSGPGRTNRRTDHPTR